jgi:TolA-binding protein
LNDSPNANAKHLINEARSIAAHAVKLLEHVDTFVRKEVEPITHRLVLVEGSTDANRRRIRVLEEQVAKLQSEIEQLRAERQTGA